MRDGFKIILVFLAIQLSVAFIAMLPPKILPCLRQENATTWIILLSMLTSDILMLVYLYKGGYINQRKKWTWSPVSAKFTVFSVFITFPVIFLSDYLLSLLAWLPNIMEQEFDRLLSNWLGIVLIALLGPVFEEILFRGTITKVLLKQYSPLKAIIISALIFGIIHWNPVQILGGGIFGLLLAWMYYRTGSLLPGIFVHIINNSLSVFLGTVYPDADYIKDLVDERTFHILFALSLILLAGGYWKMKKTTFPPPDWEERK
jgi:membrane protease YdiL (CAAX protease family)